MNMLSWLKIGINCMNELEDLLIQYGLSQEDIDVYDYEEMEDYESE